jgi:predicted nuclease with RNAse H fold
MLLRERNPKLPVSEAHPKAALWMLGEATKTKSVASITAKSLDKYFEVGRHEMETDHERDAALAALAAWAMVHRADRWKDICGLDPDALSPLPGPLAYWVPDGAPERSHGP